MKSRRQASCSGVPKALSLVISRSSGLAPRSPGSGSRRKVETSTTRSWKRTWTRRKRRPMTRELRNRRRISAGRASVAMSKSFGRRPSIKSRTLPPTSPARWPAAESRYITFSASLAMSLRETGCSARGRIRGESGTSTLTCTHCNRCQPSPPLAASETEPFCFKTRQDERRSSRGKHLRLRARGGAGAGASIRQRDLHLREGSCACARGGAAAGGASATAGPAASAAGAPPSLR